MWDNEDLIYTILTEYKKKIRNGLYGYMQRELAYNSNKIEGSTLTKEHTLTLFETGQIYCTENEAYKAKDVEEAQGHFAMFNFMLTTLEFPLSEKIIKTLHLKLKQCVFEDIANGYNIGEYKGRKNFVGSLDTTLPADVPKQMQELLQWYHSQNNVTEETLAEFHVRYESIHPFQDGNGRTGRIILLRECLVNNLCPFILQDSERTEYLAALRAAQTLKDFSPLLKLIKKQQEIFQQQVEGFLMTAPKNNI